MALNDGWNGHLTIANSAGAAQNITPIVKSFKPSRQMDMNETTAWGNGGWRSFRRGLRNGKYTLEMNRDTVLEAVFLNADTPAAGRALVYGPDGNGNGAARQTATCYIVSYEVDQDFEGVQMATAEIQVTGAIVDDAY